MYHPIEISTLTPAIRVLSDEQVRDIHYATLEIMENIGIEMQDAQGRELLLAAGAWESNGRLKIPERLLVDALAKAPSRLPMYNRLGKLTMPLELGKVFFGTGSDTIFTLDVDSRKRRQSVAQETPWHAWVMLWRTSISSCRWVWLPMHRVQISTCTNSFA